MPESRQASTIDNLSTFTAESYLVSSDARNAIVLTISSCQSEHNGGLSDDTAGEKRAACGPDSQQNSLARFAIS